MKSFLLALLVFVAIGKTWALEEMPMQGPNRIQVSGSMNSDGIYVKDVNNPASGCDCWESIETNKAIILYTVSNNNWFVYDGTCTARTGLVEDLGLANSCDPTEQPLITALADIPTLSQWAIFILGLFLTSIAIVTIRKKVQPVIR